MCLLLFISLFWGVGLGASPVRVTALSTDPTVCASSGLGRLKTRILASLMRYRSRLAPIMAFMANLQVARPANSIDFCPLSSDPLNTHTPSLQTHRCDGANNQWRFLVAASQDERSSAACCSCWCWRRCCRLCTASSPPSRRLHHPPPCHACVSGLNIVVNGHHRLRPS